MFMLKPRFLTVLALFLFCSLPARAASGDVIGEAVNSDILACVNGAPIKSYNIEGWTGIVAEDLESYGFMVLWLADERELHIEYYQSLDRGGAPSYSHSQNTLPAGSHAADIYKTDIKTFVAGREVSSFNIGGQTVIYIDSLEPYGDILWDEGGRTISYTHVKSWEIPLYEPNYSAALDENISSFLLNVARNESGGFDTDGENLDFLDYLKLSYTKRDGLVFSFSLYQRVLFQTGDLSNLLWGISTERYDGTVLSEDADGANERMAILINGSPLEIKAVTQGKGNGHTDFYFWLCGDYSEGAVETVGISLK